MLPSPKPKLFIDLVANLRIFEDVILCSTPQQSDKQDLQRRRASSKLFAEN